MSEVHEESRLQDHTRQLKNRDGPSKNRVAARSRKFVLILCLLLIIPILFQIKPARGRVITVPTEFETIQEAVNNATAGDTIQVGPGTYLEHVVVPYSLTIIGESPQTTIVDGTANGTVFDLEGSSIHITGFTICNAGNSHNAITSEREVVTNDYHRIANNIIETSQYGVSLSFSKSNTIFNNTFINNPFAAIYLYRADNTNITANNVEESAYGIKIASSINNIIIGNTFSQASYAIHLNSLSTVNTITGNVISGKTVGIYASSDSVTIDHNTITNGAYGIYIYNGKTSSIYYNTFINNSYGIRLYMTAPTSSNHNVHNNKILNTDWAIEMVYADDNTFTGNWMEQNTYGIHMSSSSFNTIYHNNFVQNSMQAYAGTGTGNVWDKDGEGNYWSDYDGEDPDGDGIGNTSYRIIPVGYDYFPLMSTWSEHDISIENITLSTNKTYVGLTVNITVTVKNKGRIGASETFNVTAKHNSQTIETKEVISLAAGANTTLTFNWNTTGAVPGNYTISAEVSTVLDELNTDNNIFTDGTIEIKILGDIDGDGDVDWVDFGDFATAYGSKGPPQVPTPDPNYNLQADLDLDGDVDWEDFGDFASNYGKTA